ncbi:hypothetical protein C0J52_12336 [Blattella germanica]|nr:hypothetical protein C0J52_12336 [Blattella germanica]
MKVVLSVSDTDTGYPTELDVLQELLPSCEGSINFAKSNRISKEKQKDVQNLMKYFEIPEGAQDFYKDNFE